ncbi:MAG: branched-chain-amino-acid transaminase [Gemmataceae bacterium]|nr:branched-chain-amino-acid transaminase [Gemmataceae bacterium]
MATPRVWINGKYFDKHEAKISVYDHGLLYGDGVFEGIRIYSGKIFRCKEHVDRLYDSARSIGLDIPISRADMTDALLDTVKTNSKVEGYIRLVVTRGVGTLGLDPRKCEPNIIIICDDISLYPPELYDNGLEIITAATIRNHPAATNPQVKSLNYLNNILAKLEAIRAGCLEAIMLNHKGEIAECTGDNIFVVKNGKIRTTPPDSGILEGVTRAVVMELSAAAGMPVVEATMTRHDIFVADELFLSGTAAELIPVVKCDGRPIGTGRPGPVFRSLLERFRAYVRT